MCTPPIPCMQSNWPIAAAEKAAEAVLLISACADQCMGMYAHLAGRLLPRYRCSYHDVGARHGMTCSDMTCRCNMSPLGQDMMYILPLGRIHALAFRDSRLALPRLPRHCKLRHHNCQQSAAAADSMLTSTYVQGKLLLRELKLLRHFRGHENVICIKDIMENPLGQGKFKVLSLKIDNIKT